MSAGDYVLGRNKGRRTSPTKRIRGAIMWVGDGTPEKGHKSSRSYEGKKKKKIVNLDGK